MTEDLASNKLESFIFEDDKLVTYKWLSRELGVHVNLSKKMLWEFWHNYKGNVDITVTFLLMGQLTDGSVRIEVVEESNLSFAKEKFAKIDCEHIYSLQRTLSDLQMLALVMEIDARFTAIKFKESAIKSTSNLGMKLQEEEQIHENIGKSHKLITEATEMKMKENSNLAKHKFQSTVDSTPKHKIEEKVKQIKTKDKKNKISENTSKKLSGFENFFGKASDSIPKCLSTEDGEISEKEKIKDNSSCSSNVKGVMVLENVKIFEEKGIFAKQNDNICKRKKTEEKNSSTSTSGKNNKRKVRNDKKANDVTVKKRKRILSSSDSSESEDERESVLTELEEEKEQVVEENCESVEEFKKSVSPPRMKKKDITQTKDRTFLDEDGFLVTQKVVVHKEAVKEDVEREVPPPKVCKEASVNKKQTKQATLTSFFKKV